MLVSIIMPCYNAESCLEVTIESVRRQSYKDWELLITDDCSTDGSYDILERYKAIDSRISCFRLDSNKGAAIARNYSIAMSKGQYLAFLDADDYWVETKLSEQIEFMERNHCDFSFTAYQMINKKGQVLGVVDNQSKKVFDYEDMLRKRATMGCSTVMLRKSAFSDLVMPNLRTGQDYALWLKLLRSGKRAELFPKVNTHYKVLPRSISRNKCKKALRQWQIYRKIEELTLIKSLECFIYYAYGALFRR